MIPVTDHALVRFLERAKGIDVEGFRRQIAESLGSPSTKRLIEFSGGANCKIKKGNAVYCLRGKTVTTYIER